MLDRAGRARFRTVPTHAMSNAKVYTWRAKYAGMDDNLVSKVKAIASKNRRLKCIYTDVRMQNNSPKAALGRK